MLWESSKCLTEYKEKYDNQIKENESFKKTILAQSQKIQNLTKELECTGDLLECKNKEILSHENNLTLLKHEFSKIKSLLIQKDNQIQILQEENTQLKSKKPAKTADCCFVTPTKAVKFVENIVKRPDSIAQFVKKHVRNTGKENNFMKKSFSDMKTPLSELKNSKRIY